MSELLVTNDLLVSQWDYNRNTDIDISKITLGSNKKVWWKCVLGHSWEAAIASRASGSGCPYCSNKKVLAGFNDLETTNPRLALEWHPTKNGPLLPNSIMAGAGKKVWWMCDKGHEWQATPNKRTSDKTGCPYCSNKRVLRGFNDLATTNPRLAAEWHPTKNGSLTANDITEGSGEKVWWKCARGHEWQATPSNRIKNRNCPVCGKQLRTSFPEQALYFYIKKYLADAENGNISAIPMELDIYIPSIKTAVEHDGVFYHRSKNSEKREIRKNQICNENGIRLIRVREKGLHNYEDCECVISEQPENYLSIKNPIEKVLELLGVSNYIVNIEKDLSRILESYIVSGQKRNLQEINPKLAKEWHPIKNGELNPEYLFANSGKKVWWICENGHEWQASLHNRMKGKGCPYCSGRATIQGKNDLAKLHPGLLEEWDYEKNLISPNEVKPGSNKSVWWKCKKCGYEWQTKICNRTKGTGCPICAKTKKGPKRKTHVQFKAELQSVNPNIELVGTYSVSTQKVRCCCKRCSHEWDALPGNLLKGKGCPICARNHRRKT